MRVGREASATCELLGAGRSDQNGVLHSSLTAGIERAHIEDIDTLHLSQDFQSLQTGGLFKIGGNGTRLGTRAEQVVLRLDLCKGNTSLVYDSAN